MTNQKREIIANTQHEIWSHWTKWQFSICIQNTDGSLTIPSEKVERWARQMNTDYSNLSNREQDSDREQADKVIAAIEEGERQELDEFIFALESTGSPFEKVEAIKVYKDGDAWCALIGKDIQYGRAAFGDTAVEALINLQNPGGF